MARGAPSRGRKPVSKPRDSRRRVFLDIPYKKSYERYERAIVATLLCNGLVPVLAKESRQTTFILEDVCELMRSANYAVVDISGLNFNVAFEAGFLQALGRKYILLKDRQTRVPADLQGLKYCEYSDKAGLIRELTEWIKQNVPEAQQSPHRGALTRIIEGIEQNSHVSRDVAVEMVLSIMEDLAESDRKLPLT
jgi:hypothetical protein